MSMQHLVEPALYSGAAFLLLLGAVTALAATHNLRRVGGVVIAHLGALIALAASGAADTALIAAAAAAFCMLGLGVVLAARLYESHGASQSQAIDAADADNDSDGRAA